MIRCLAIDDEPLALRQIRSYIERIPQLDLAATFSNAIEAREWLLDNSADLIFVDINMPGLSGVDFVRSLANPPMIIFTTAYSEYAVEGFKLDAIDYLLKPFGFDELQRSATKALSLHELRQLRDSATSQSSEVTEEPSADKEYISIRADHKTSLIKVANIVFLESEGEYVRLHLNDGTKLVTLFRLKNMESSLPVEMFMRVHRSYIINTTHISGYTKGRVFLDSDDYVPIGESYKEAFAELVKRKL
ncbi:MAG: response regulator transcription factor [Alistipes sp.]|nr:response regulator transcription factor [Alistipes sp.]MBQ7856652.1 response regulator transcription factor [Alistipes sp.]